MLILRSPGSPRTMESIFLFVIHNMQDNFAAFADCISTCKCDWSPVEIVSDAPAMSNQSPKLTSNLYLGYLY